MATEIVNYDAGGYDYRHFWDDRDYELWAERRALRRAVSRLGPARWFIDCGGGFGRNAEHYRPLVDRFVLVDYSATNLTNAAELLADDVAAGRAVLVRCDVGALPFADRAFDAGMVVRVLHHLVDLDRALDELGGLDQRQARVVELRFCGGLSLEETAENLGVSLATVNRDWRLARAWLHQRVREGASEG